MSATATASRRAPKDYDSAAELGLFEPAATQVNAIRGLVHPMTDQFRLYEDMWARRNVYSEFIAAASADKSSFLVFVGTATEDTPGKLGRLDAKLARRLTEELPKLLDKDREALTEELRAAGLNIKKGARYGFLEELGLIRQAVKTMPRERLIYFNGSIEPDRLKRALDGRKDPSALAVQFTGEKPDVCVKGQCERACQALGISREKANIT